MLTFKRETAIPLLALATAGFLWGTGFFFGKIALSEMPVATMVLFRFVFACAGLVPFLLIDRPRYPPLHELDMFRSGEYLKRLSGKQAKQKHPFLKKKFPVTQKAAWETVWIPQPALLGDEEDMHEIAAGLVGKIQKNAKELV